MGGFGGFYKGEKKKKKQAKDAKVSFGTTDTFTLPELISKKKKDE